MKAKTDEEILDLVDENDEVIGKVGKSEANSDLKLIHREIGVLIYDGRKRVLFNKRSLTLANF